MSTMSRQEMEALLAQLRREVSAARELSDSQRARIDALQEQIERQVAAGSGGDQDDESPRDQLRAYIDEFQLSHPTLTLVLGRILDHLNKMGI